MTWPPPISLTEPPLALPLLATMSLSLPQGIDACSFLDLECPVYCYIVVCDTLTPVHLRIPVLATKSLGLGNCPHPRYTGKVVHPMTECIHSINIS